MNFKNIGVPYKYEYAVVRPNGDVAAYRDTYREAKEWAEAVYQCSSEYYIYEVEYKLHDSMEITE